MFAEKRLKMASQCGKCAESIGVRLAATKKSLKLKRMLSLNQQEDRKKGN
jgi:hypothetical protein